MTDTPTPDSGVSTLTVLGVAAAVSLVPLNSTMIAVALPKIAADFDISTSRAGILITIYLVAMLIGQPLAGRLGDAIGNRRTVTIALVGLIAFSALAAATATFAQLIAARVAQAVFAAALGPNVQSLLRAISPEAQRGRTFGLMGSVLAAGAASGPVIGGVLTQLFGWQAIFLFNIPVAAIALVVASRITTRPAVPTHAAQEREIDATGRIANPVFVAAFSVQALSTLAQYALLLLTPIILDARGWDSGPIGLVLSALTIGMIAMSPTGGRLGDRYGRRSPSRAGLLVATAAIVALLIGGQSIAIVALVAGLAVFGFGLGVTVPSLMTAALESVPMHRTGAAAGVLSMSRYVGSITTSVAVSVFVASNADGSRIVLAMSTVAMAIAIVSTAALPDQGRATRRTPRRAHPVRARQDGWMELSTALEWAAKRRNAALITIRSDGRPQSSDIAYVVDGGSFLISVTHDRAKTRNMARDPRIVLHISEPSAWSYVSFDGTVDLSPVAAATDDETSDRLVEYYRAVAGSEHSDWAEYRQAMIDEGRLIVTFTPTSAVGQINS